jgi:hypothetical protein
MGFNRRITEILLRYWLDLREEREMPQEKDIDPNALTNVWNSCFLVKMTDAASHGGYRYAYMGKELLNAFGEDVSRDDAEILVSLPSMRVTAKFDQAVGMRKPLIDEGEFLNAKKISVKYRQILLPMADNKKPKELAYLFGGMRWKSF